MWSHTPEPNDDCPLWCSNSTLDPAMDAGFRTAQPARVAPPPSRSPWGQAPGTRLLHDSSGRDQWSLERGWPSGGRALSQTKAMGHGQRLAQSRIRRECPSLGCATWALEGAGRTGSLRTTRSPRLSSSFRARCARTSESLARRGPAASATPSHVKPLLGSSVRNR